MKHVWQLERSRNMNFGKLCVWYDCLSWSFTLSLKDVEKRVIVICANIGSETTYSKTFCLLKLFYPWRERYRRSELRNQLPAQWAAKPAVSVNFHRLVIIILGAPLTCNTPAAAPPETKKTTPRMFSFLYLRFGVLKYEIWLSLISI